MWNVSDMCLVKLNEVADWMQGPKSQVRRPKRYTAYVTHAELLTVCLLPQCGSQDWHRKFKRVDIYRCKKTQQLGWTAVYKTHFTYNTSGERSGTEVTLVEPTNHDLLQPRRSQQYSSKCTNQVARGSESPTTSAPTTAATPSAIATSTPATTPSVILLPVLRFWRIVHEQSVERKSVGKDEITNVVAADGEGVKGGGFTVARGHFDGFEMCVHLHIHACGQSEQRK